jgi:DNA (cytosine-5)-methyltransferase 1
MHSKNFYTFDLKYFSIAVVASGMLISTMLCKQKQYRVLSCFSGIAGLCALGIDVAQLNEYFQVTQFIEKSSYCQKILRERFPYVPVHGDICTFYPQLGSFDVVVGGFPCTDISIAGKQAGIVQGKQSGLFFELIRIIASIRPDFVLLENVSHLLTGGDSVEEPLWNCTCCNHLEEIYAQPASRTVVCANCCREMGNAPARLIFTAWMGTVLKELSQIGYDAEWSSVSCAEVGGVHKRERIFIIAYPTADSDSPRTRMEIKAD